MRVVDKASQHGHESPRNQNPCNPDAAAELVQKQVAGNFKKEIAQKEDTGDQTELLAGDSQLLVHRQRRKPNVDPVEKADDVQKEKKWENQDTQYTNCSDLIGVRMGVNFNVYARPHERLSAC